MSIIKDGSGTGNTLRINEENRADVESVTRPIEQHINEAYSKAFVMSYVNVDPTGADDYIVYMKNTGTKNLHIHRMIARSEVVCTLTIEAVSATPGYVSATDLVASPLTLGSSNSLTGTFKSDANITGLTSESILLRHRVPVVNTDHLIDFPSHIIIPPGQALAIAVDSATAVVSGSFYLYEDQGVT